MFLYSADPLAHQYGTLPSLSWIIFNSSILYKQRNIDKLKIGIFKLYNLFWLLETKIFGNEPQYADWSLGLYVNLFDERL